MAKSQSTSKAVTKAPRKEEEKSAEMPARKPITSADEMLVVVSRQCFTVEHIKKATGHIHELAMMLYEAQANGNKTIESLCDTTHGVEVLLDMYANEIEESTKYFDRIIELIQKTKPTKLHG